MNLVLWLFLDLQLDQCYVGIKKTYLILLIFMFLYRQDFLSIVPVFTKVKQKLQQNIFIMNFNEIIFLI